MVHLFVVTLPLYRFFVASLVRCCCSRATAFANITSKRCNGIFYVVRKFTQSCPALSFHSMLYMHMPLVLSARSTGNFHTYFSRFFHYVSFDVEVKEENG